MSSFRLGTPDDSAIAASLKRRLENMFWVTNISAAINAYNMPLIFSLRSAEQASITPSVRGIRDKYVAIGYRILYTKRYAITVKSGESPLMVWTKETGITVVAAEDRR